MYVKYDSQPSVPKNTKGCAMIGNTENKRIMKTWMWDRQKGKCFWCNCHISLPPPDWKNTRESQLRESALRGRATFDHMLPKCKGGKNVLSNLVLSCRNCNESRSDMGIKGTVKWFKGTGASVSMLPASAPLVRHGKRHPL